MWILIIILGSQLNTVNFASQQTCLKAANQLASQYQVICVEK